MEEQSPPSPNNNNIVQSNPQIAAALAGSVDSLMQQGPPSVPQQQQQNMGPNGSSNGPNEPQFVSPPPPMGMGGPMRIQPMNPQMRAIPYPQMRAQGPPGQHFSPMGIQQQPQFAPNGQPQMQMQPRPQMQPPQGGQHPMGMGTPGPSGMMAMGPTQPQFVQNPSPMPPPQMVQQQHPQPQPQPHPQHVHQSTVPCGLIMEKTKLDDLMSQVSTHVVLEENVKDLLVEFADDFVTGLIDKACKMIKNREVKKIEARDIEFLLKNVYSMPVVPRAATHIFGNQNHNEVIDLSKEKHIPTEAHKQRVALLKKQLRKA